MFDYFKDIFSSSRPHTTDDALDGVERRVSNEMNMVFLREFQPHEVRDALF